MQRYKAARIALVPALAFSLTLGAVAPIVANAQQMDEGKQETTQEMPRQRGRLAKITAVDGTHYTAEILGRHGRGGKGVLEPPANLEDGELPEKLSDNERLSAYPSGNESQTIEFDIDGKDFAVGDVVELSFGEDETVTDAEKLDLESMPEKKDGRGFGRRAHGQENDTEGDANQA